MHVALVTWSSPNLFGGIESFIRLLAGRLAAGGTEVTVVAPTPAGSFEGDWGRRTWHHPGLRRREAEDAAVVQAFSEDFGAFLAEEAVDVVHSHNLHVPVAPGIPAAIEQEARRRSIPHVLTVHDVTDYRGADLELARLRDTVVVTQSAYNEEMILRTTGRGATRLPVGVDFSSFRPQPAHEARTVALLGRIRPAKGLLETLTELAALASLDAPIRVLLSDRDRNSVGRSATYVNALEAAARASAGVELEFLCGADPVPVACRRAALTIVRPQAPEGFSLVALESLASGRPVVAIPTGGMAEWLYGLPGVVCLPSGGDELRKAVADILRDWPRWYDAAREARGILRPQFDAAVVERAHRRFYTRLIRRGPAGRGAMSSAH